MAVQAGFKVCVVSVFRPPAVTLKTVRTAPLAPLRAEAENICGGLPVMTVHTGGKRCVCVVVFQGRVTLETVPFAPGIHCGRNKDYQSQSRCCTESSKSSPFSVVFRKSPLHIRKPPSISLSISLCRGLSALPYSACSIL